jgi:hypothetical protein
MKKHPVDDLFKHRLADLEKKPSSDAWQKIQERSKTQRKAAVGWIWYAAASVIIATIVGYMVWENDSNELMNSDKPGKTIAAAENKKPVIPEVENDQQDSKDQIAILEKKKQTDSIKSVVSPTGKEKSRKEENILFENISNIQNEQESVAVIEKKEINTSAEHIHEAPSIAAKIEEVKILPDVSAVSQVKKQDTEPTRTIVVAVETNADEVDDKPKNSRFSRVFRQLKNARAGERVDWEEVGFNPKTLVAKVDDRLHNRDEKESEKYQTPKERTKL